MPDPEPLALWDGPIDSGANMRRDEELLRAGAPAVRVAVLTDEAVSVGVAQRETDAVFTRAARANLRVVRRTTRGTGILHRPGDLVWSVVVPRSHPLVGTDFTCAYPRLGQGVVDALGAVGVPGVWSPPMDLSEEFCLLGPRGHVLTVQGRALGGAAQHVTRQALLHQGMIARTIDRARLSELFEVPLDELERRTTALVELVEAPIPERLGPRLLDALELVVRQSGRSPGPV
ncbi:MAG: hypothetical protein L3K19_06090 [Thermoplasmata archaeon]|nr:hypothetical protein [Thermoplasmata archaeon]